MIMKKYRIKPLENFSTKESVNFYNKLTEKF